MNRDLNRGLGLLAFFFLLFFLLVIFNQLVGLYGILARWNSVAALVVTLLLGFLLLIPILRLFLLRRIPELPADQEGKEYRSYLALRISLLRKNRYLKSVSFSVTGEDKEAMEQAHEVLRQKGLEIIKRDASAIFLSTAISQNGVLDSLTVLFTLLRMIYALALLHENRPHMGRLLYLYGQVAAVVLIARSIEDMDLIEEQLEPLMASLLGGSVLSLVPGAVAITQIITSSLMEGSINALLALRVGVITQRCLEATSRYDRRELRRGASLEAARHLGGILKENVTLVARSFSEAAKNATLRSFRRA